MIAAATETVKCAGRFLMPSLNSLVAAHRRVLLIDSSSISIQVALWRLDGEAAPPCGPERRQAASSSPANPARERLDSSVPPPAPNPSASPESIWHASDQEAGIAIFTGVDAVLGQAGLRVADLGAAVFCEGPGSILGIRTAAVALRTWAAAEGRALPVFAYRSLELVAHDLRRRGIPPPFAVLADARRNSWHWVEAPADGPIGPLQRVPDDTAAGFVGRLFTPAGFRAWARPPGTVSTIPYALPDLWRRMGDADLLRAAPQPDAFLHEDATYVAWTPQIHRNPGGAHKPRRR